MRNLELQCNEPANLQRNGIRYMNSGADNHLINVTDSSPDTLGNGSGYQNTRASGKPVT